MGKDSHKPVGPIYYGLFFGHRESSLRIWPKCDKISRQDAANAIRHDGGPASRDLQPIGLKRSRDASLECCFSEKNLDHAADSLVPLVNSVPLCGQQTPDSQTTPERIVLATKTHKRHKSKYSAEDGTTRLVTCD